MLDKLMNIILNKKKEVTFDTSLLIKKEWDSIDILLKQGGPSKLTQALISADRSLDIALKDIVKGQSLGDRLKAAKKLFKEDLYSRVWKAHKLRNNFVHESLYEAPHYVIKDAVEDLRECLKTLKQKI